MTSGRVLFVRHAQSRKNLEEITGGPGAALTEAGRAQGEIAASEVAQALDRSGAASDVRVVSSPPEQCQETAKLIADKLGVDCAVDSALCGAGMGPLAGLTNTDLSERYPDAAERLALWRRGVLEAHELHLPDMEPPSDFWSRTLRALSRHNDGSSLVVVTTRSLMVLAANLRLGRHPGVGGGYTHREIAYCEVVEVEWALLAKLLQSLPVTSSGPHHE